MFVASQLHLHQSHDYRVNKQHLSHIKVFDGGRCQRALQNPLVLSQTECFRPNLSSIHGSDRPIEFHMACVGGSCVVDHIACYVILNALIVMWELMIFQKFLILVREIGL